MNDNRRDFLRNSVVWSALSASRVLGANERIRVAALGTGGRCSYLLGLASKAGADIVALCDVYEPHRLAAQEKLAPAARADYVDYREVLDRKDLDGVIIGSPYLIANSRLFCPMRGQRTNLPKSRNSSLKWRFMATCRRHRSCWSSSQAHMRTL